MIREHLTSRSNPAIKTAASLKTSSGCRKKNRYLIEGPKFISDMLNRKDPLEYLVISEEAGGSATAVAERAIKAGVTVLTVSRTVLSDVSSTEHSQGLVGVAPVPSCSADQVFTGGTVLVLDCIGDPGNAGTAIRSAAAFNCSGVVFLKGSTFPWNPKVTRSSAGLNSTVPVAEVESLYTLKKNYSSYRYIGASASGSMVSELKETGPICLVIGSEAHGLSETTLSHIDRSVSIPMAPCVESLNAGVSASILLYELLRTSG